jgi:hypothetical protein
LRRFEGTNKAILWQLPPDAFFVILAKAGTQVCLDFQGGGRRKRSKPAPNLGSRFRGNDEPMYRANPPASQQKGFALG